MLRFLLTFVLATIYFPATIYAEGVFIVMTAKVTENSDPKEKNTWEQDNRSITYFPVVIQDGNTLFVYSDISLNNLQITVKDKTNNIIYFNIVTISKNQPCSFVVEYKDNEEYIIELAYKETLFYGTFQK